MTTGSCLDRAVIELGESAPQLARRSARILRRGLLAGVVAIASPAWRPPILAGLVISVAYRPASGEDTEMIPPDVAIPGIGRSSIAPSQ